MLPILSRIPNCRIWWAGLFLFCLIAEIVALYYQYQLNYLPCVLCIHVRMLLFALMIISIIGFVFAGNTKIALGAFILSSAVWIWMAERSWQLLGTERGWIFGECQMKSGLPNWLNLEGWFPWIFQIHEPCGYTPYLVSKISMAEVLIVVSVLACVFSAVVLVTNIKNVLLANK